MRGRYKITKAKKQWTCTERSHHTIKPGDLYLDAACPPEHEANDGRKWWVMRVCLRCAEERGMHTSNTREQLIAAQPQKVSE